MSSVRKEFLFVYCDDERVLPAKVMLPVSSFDDVIISASRSDSNSSVGSATLRPRARSPSDRGVISSPSHYLRERLRNASQPEEVKKCFRRIESASEMDDSTY